MKNILLFAGIAGLAAAIAIYFSTEANSGSGTARYITDAEMEAYDINENTSDPQPVTDRGFNAMS
jgi:hypothetical protein